MTKEELLAEYDRRHERCLGTDGTYTDKEMVTILSNTLKTMIVEDRKWLEEVI